ncbi:MAG: methylglutaconyl-CoA hydratase [Planctomycetaceae bacterium]
MNGTWKSKMEINASLYEVKNNAAWITLNRPDNRNALSAELVNGLHGHLLKALQDPLVRVIVMTGTGPAFCAGADLKSPPGSSISGGGKAVPFADVLQLILLADKPVIAAVNGSAFGGGLGLVAAADIVISADSAQFSFSEVRLGVIPAVISVVILPKLGKHLATRLFLTGERFNGPTAVEYGLAHLSVADSELVAAVDKEVAVLAQGGPGALKACKELIREIPKLSIEDGFEKAASWSVKMFESEEGTEGMAAFREKRKPSWIKSR